MKNLYCILTLLILTMHSCMRHSYSPRLVTADSLCHTNPDSAMRMLGTMSADTTGMGSDDLWYYRPLCIKAADKAYIKPASSKEADRILRHYEDGGDSRLLSEAYFYAGSVYRDLNDAPQAIEYFQKALKCMPEEKKRMKGLCYWNICNLLELQGLYKNALSKLKDTYRYSIAIKDTSLLCFTMREMGWCYKMTHNNDSALATYDKALDIIKKTDNKELTTSINVQKASILKAMGQYEEAEKTLRLSMKYCNATERSTFLAIASDLYIKTGRKDSAIILMKELARVGNIDGKQFAYKHLGIHHINTGNIEQAKECFIKYEVLTDSLHKTAAEESVARMNSLYDYRQKELENIRLKNKNKRNYVFIFCTSTAVIILLLLLLLVKYRNKKEILELDNRNATLKKSLEKYEQQLQKNIDKKKQKIKELEEKNVETANDKEKEDLILRRNQLYCDLITAKADRLARIEACGNLKKSEIYQKLLRMCKDCNSCSRVSDEDWMQLDEIINKLYPNWYDVLSKLCKMSKHEYNVCMLLKAEFTPIEISEFTNRSKSAINSTRQRLYQKNFGDKGDPQRWDKLIRSI